MMNKKTIKFELSFNLNLVKDEQLDSTSLRAFKNQLFNFVQEWNGYHGHFYGFGSYLGDRDINPTAVKVKRVK